MDSDGSIVTTALTTQVEAGTALIILGTPTPSATTAVFPFSDQKDTAGNRPHS